MKRNAKHEEPFSNISSAANGELLTSSNKLLAVRNPENKCYFKRRRNFKCKTASAGFDNVIISQLLFSNTLQI